MPENFDNFNQFSGIMYLLNHSERTSPSYNSNSPSPWDFPPIVSKETSIQFLDSLQDSQNSRNTLFHRDPAFVL